MKRFVLFFVASLLVVACDNKFEDEGNSRQDEVDMPTLTANFEDVTRTYVEDNFDYVGTRVTLSQRSWVILVIHNISSKVKPEIMAVLTLVARYTYHEVVVRHTSQQQTGAIMPQT